MSGYDWSKFCKRIPVNAGKQEVYDAWSTKSGIEKWFLRSAVFRPSGEVEREANESVQAGDAYTWHWYGYGDEMAEYGTIIKANGSDLFKFSFAGNCEVSVYIREEEGETVVELWQENIPTDESGKVKVQIGCGEGWTFYLANLKSILEGGIDLRNRNEKIRKVISS